MAGPIAMAVLRTLRPVVCPHCGARQLRAPTPRAYRVCSKCKRRFTDPTKR
jgi:DNA-directed RNA polymerase subunit RPC12/RpoP